MDEKTTTIKVTVDNQVVNDLERVALKVREEIRDGKRPKSGRGRPYGASNVASAILERVIRDYPELIKEFFEDESSEVALPKGGSRRAAK